MLALLCSFGVASAQSTLKTAYFMDRMPMRHKLNPALMSEYGYFSIPILGDVNVSVNSNLSIDKFLYPMSDGTLGLFAHPSINSSDFLDGLRSNNVIKENLNLTLFGFGFHSENAYNTFDVSLRQNATVNLPISLFEFIVGADDGISVYDMSGTSINTTAWAEFAYGHSRRINDRLTVGIKVKYLSGLATADFTLDDMNFKATADNLALSAYGTGNVSIIAMPLVGSFDDLSLSDFDLSAGLNHGFGLDLGATYEWKKFNFSMALTDLGFIRWANPSSISAGDSVEFNGFSGLDFDDFDGSTEQDLEVFENFGDALSNPEFTAKDKYTTWLSASLNIGAEYDVFGDNKLSAGLLSTTTFSTVTTTECMLAATYSPTSWFDIALSGTVSSFGPYWGFAMNICPRWINFYIGADSMVTNITPQGVPYSSSNLNLKFGLSIPLGKIKDVN